MSHQLKLYFTEINEYMFTTDANKIQQGKNFMSILSILIFHIPFL